MKQERLPVRAALMLSAAALLATPVLAQVAAPADQAVPVTPPPAPSTPPPATSAPPAAKTPPATTTPTAPTASTPPATTASGESATPVNPEAAAQAAAEDAEARPARRANTTTRGAVRRTNAPANPEPAPPPPPPPPPPESQNLPAQTAPAAPATDPNAVTEVGNTTAATEQPQEQAAEPAPAAEPGPPMWPLALLALLIVVGGVWFLMSRRRKAAAEDQWAAPPLAAEPVVHRDPVIERPVAQESVRPAPVAPVAAAAAAAPIAADVSDVAPVAAEDASIETAHKDDVAALTAADTVGDRPWLEFAMRPVRAGTSADEALVEIELTVANAGNMVAEDVRISTFMLPAGNDGDLDEMLVKGDDTVTPQTIAAGEGTRVDATLAMTRASLPEGGTFQPVVVADARYRLPNGGEGRTSAAFLVGGLAEDGTTIQPIDLEGRLIREDVSAQLYRDPVRV